MCLFADVGGLENAQTLGIGGHDAVLDSVVNHFNEVAGAIWTAMQITLFSGTADPFTARRARNIAYAWRECRKNWIEMLHDLPLAANHHAVTSLQSPDAAAGAHVH